MINIRYRSAFSPFFITLLIAILTASFLSYSNTHFITTDPLIFTNKVSAVINLVYCTTLNQLYSVGISSLSIINRTKKNLHIYLFTPELFDKTNTIFDKIETETNGRVHFFQDTINFTLCKETFHNQWNFWNPFAYARIFMIEKVPVKKCIYIDTDVYGCDDIDKLWRVNLGSNLIAAVLDRMPRGRFIGSAHMEILNSIIRRLNPDEIQKMNNTGLTINNYFNSGVLLMNIEEMNKVNFSKRCADGYRKNQTFYPDQDILNIITGHRRVILDWRFNKPMSGSWSKCVLRHYNHKKVTHPSVNRNTEDYHFYFDAKDEYYRLMSKRNRTISNAIVNAK